MRVVILGCGRVGALLASQLDADRHVVSVIDRNPDQFDRLEPSFSGLTVLGNGIDQDVLRQAGIEQADCFVAVTNGDNTNAVASQVVREFFSVPRVIARIYDPVREKMYKGLGLETYCPTTLGVSIVRGIMESEPAAGPSGEER